MKRIIDPHSKIDTPHLDGPVGLPHDREQLRRRLLKMILKSEAQRRGTRIGGKSQADTHVELVVYDPEDQIGQELVASATPPKRA